MRCCLRSDGLVFLFLKSWVKALRPAVSKGCGGRRASRLTQTTVWKVDLQAELIALTNWKIPTWRPEGWIHTSQDRCPCAFQLTALGEREEQEQSEGVSLQFPCTLIAQSCLFKAQ